MIGQACQTEDPPKHVCYALVLLLLMDLRRSYDLLMMKVLSLLQDEDQKLASAIVSSREAIWALLADPKTVATLQG